MPLSQYETPPSDEYVDNLRLTVETHRSKRFVDVNGIDFNVSHSEKKMIIGQMLARVFLKWPMMKLLCNMKRLDIEFCSTEVTHVNLIMNESRDDLISVLVTLDHREGILECFSQLVHILGQVAKGDLHLNKDSVYAKFVADSSLNVYFVLRYSINRIYQLGIVLCSSECKLL